MMMMMMMRMMLSQWPSNRESTDFRSKATFHYTSDGIYTGNLDTVARFVSFNDLT